MDFEKKDITHIKFYLSTLFNRQMNYIITVPSNDTLLYTTIDYAALLNNNLQMDDVVHYVSFKNKAIIEQIYESLLYNLKDNQCFLEIQKILTQINKCLKDKIYNFKIIIKDSKIYFTYKPNEETTNQFCCGKVLNDNEIEKYLTIRSKITKFKTGVTETKAILLTDLIKKQISFLERIVKNNHICIPMLDGHNLPDIGNFLSNLKDTFILNLVTIISKNIFRYNIYFSNEDLEIESFVINNIFFLKDEGELVNG